MTFDLLSLHCNSAIDTERSCVSVRLRAVRDRFRKDGSKWTGHAVMRQAADRSLVARRQGQHAEDAAAVPDAVIS